MISLTTACYLQGDHLSGKPGNARDFDSCQGHVRDFTDSQGIVREKILSGEKLFIVSCIFVSILDFAEFVHFIFGFRSCTVALLPPPLTITLVPA